MKFDLTKTDLRARAIEPFVFGERGIIYTKADAERVLKDNSYYFFVAAFILLVFGVLFVVHNEEKYYSVSAFLFCIFYILIGLCLRKLKSRAAAILALLSVGNLILVRILDAGINVLGGFSWILFLFLAAAIRSVKASFIYHRKV